MILSVIKCDWFPRTDTTEHAKYDKRTPGLFKVEREGSGIISLCRRRIIFFGVRKINSCKGVSKNNYIFN